MPRIDPPTTPSLRLVSLGGVAIVLPIGYALTARDWDLLARLLVVLRAQGPANDDSHDDPPAR